MSHTLEMSKTIRGITVQVVCHVVGTTVIRDRSLWVHRQKTPVAILITQDGNTRVFDLDGNTGAWKDAEDIRRQSPDFGQLLN